MKTLTTIGLALALTAAACGGAAEDSTGQPDAETTTTAPTLTTLGENVTTSSPPTSDAPEEPIVEETAVPVTTEPGEEQVPVQPISHPDGDVAIAMTDLAARFGFTAEDISLVSAEEVTWRDGSLGCPLPDMRYTQALVNGRRIVLAAGGAEYNYHSGGGREPFYCAKPAEPIGDGEDL